jgi:hypothetical protein
MYTNSRKVRLWQLGLILGGGLFLVLVLVTAPALSSCLLSRPALIGVGFIVAAGYMAAKFIGEIAGAILHGPQDPWYARPWALLFLCLVVPPANAVLTVAAGPFLKHAGIEEIMPRHAFILGLVGVELLWFVILGGCGAGGQCQNDGQWRHTPQNFDPGSVRRNEPDDRQSY